MNRILKVVLLSIMVALGSLVASAQSGTLVQQSATHLDAATCINANAAVNNTVTLTIPAGSPNAPFIYLTELDIQVANDATGAVTQANVKFTTTNLNSYQIQYSSANAANTSTSFGPFNFGPGAMKSVSPSTAVTVVSPAANTHAAYNINACFYYGQ